MSTRRAAMFLVLAVAMAVTASAWATTAAKDPAQLLLRQADFPAGTTYDADTGIDVLIDGKLEARGVDADAANYVGATYSNAKGFLQVSGIVYATASSAKATTAFSVLKKDRDAWWKKFGGGKARISVPSYGAQQFARHDPAGNEGIGIIELLVRKNTVVWLLTAKIERRPAVQTAILLAELKKYALKQKQRVGSG
jgi:hypothetical protein